MSRRRNRSQRQYSEAACRDSNSGLIRQQWALVNVSMPCDERGGRPAYYYSLTDRRQGNCSIRLFRKFWREVWSKFNYRPLGDVRQMFHILNNRIIGREIFVSTRI